MMAAHRPQRDEEGIEAAHGVVVGLLPEVPGRHQAALPSP